MAYVLSSLLLPEKPFFWSFEEGIMVMKELWVLARNSILVLCHVLTPVVANGMAAPTTVDPDEVPITLSAPQKRNGVCVSSQSNKNGWEAKLFDNPTTIDGKKFPAGTILLTGHQNVKVEVPPEGEGEIEVTMPHVIATHEGVLAAMPEEGEIRAKVLAIVPEFRHECALE